MEIHKSNLVEILGNIKGFKIEYQKGEDVLNDKYIGKIKYSNNSDGSFNYLLEEGCCRWALMKEIHSENVKGKALSKIIELNENLASSMGYLKLIIETENEDVLEVLEERNFNFNSNPFKGEKFLK